MNRDELTYKKVNTEDIQELADIACEVWHEYFTCILSDEQIDYMVDKFQSAHAITEQMANQGYEYYFICHNNEKLGYFGIKPDGDRLFLSKLYLLKHNRGKGYAGEALNHIFDICRQYGKKAVWLTVNRHNDHTIDVYKHKGFIIIDEQAADIGNGFVMDDYFMERTI